MFVLQVTESSNHYKLWALTIAFTDCYWYTCNCYDTVKEEVVIFFIYSSGFYIRFYFGVTFLLLYWWWQWRGTWYCGYMTCHMMWWHKSLEWTRAGWSSLNGWCQGVCSLHGYLIVYTWYTYGWHMDIRAEVIICSTDHV